MPIPLPLTRRAAALSFAGVAALASSPAWATPSWPVPQPDPALWDPQGFPLRESWAQGPNGRVYVRTYGAPSRRPPVIVLHGGPAAGLEIMLPYAALATDRQVALYDQSGCGRSASPNNLALYSVPRYVEELEAVRAHLGWERPVVLGASWGSFLAPAYAAVHPNRVTALVLAGSAVGMADFQEAERRWMRALGPEAVAVADEAVRTGRVDTPAVQALQEHYYGLHLCRLRPWPPLLLKVAEALGSNRVYAYLNGPSEFQFTGALANLDVRPQLAGLRVPVLVTCGEFDEAPPWVGRRVVAAVDGGRARLQVFSGLSHLSHFEDPSRVTAATSAFLRSLS